MCSLSRHARGGNGRFSSGIESVDRLTGGVQVGGLTLILTRHQNGDWFRAAALVAVRFALQGAVVDYVITAPTTQLNDLYCTLANAAGLDHASASEAQRLQSRLHIHAPDLRHPYRWQEICDQLAAKDASGTRLIVFESLSAFVSREQSALFEAGDAAAYTGLREARLARQIAHEMRVLATDVQATAVLLETSELSWPRSRTPEQLVTSAVFAPDPADVDAALVVDDGLVWGGQLRRPGEKERPCQGPLPLR